ncbi:gamma-butyrobetaine hydroxylase-like domain-containing protein [Agaricicola taiwanensis]|uniref:gamma-butyrobetaine hydroxylase-like domain-containing protein n=1 Tax=Agaricicola taiwanensis TaxID=591372 RepID=UPI001E3968F3|nr:DUF971 domain-containing protein [Agaricicola taiwanensis]
MTALWPLELRLAKSRDHLTVMWDDGRSDRLDAEYLRVESPSAEVQGHGPGEKKLVAGKRQVRVEAVEPVGNYAVKLVFDDGHSSGIFTWNYLRTLADDHGERWARYLAELEATGSRRDP